MSTRKQSEYKTPENSKGEKGTSTLSKKRYAELRERVNSIMGDENAAAEVLKAMCEVMRFDPNVSRYSDDMRGKLVENTRKWRQRKKDEVAKAKASTSVNTDVETS
jgi:hypothetical protein